MSLKHADEWFSSDEDEQELKIERRARKEAAEQQIQAKEAEEELKLNIADSDKLTLPVEGQICMFRKCAAADVLQYQKVLLK